MEQRDQHDSQRNQPQQIDIPTLVEVEHRQVFHRRAGEIKEVRVIGGERAVDIQHQKRRQHQQPHVFPQHAETAQLRPPRQDQIDGKPHQSCVIDKALIGRKRRKIRAVGRDQDGAEAAQRPRGRQKIHQHTLETSFFSEGDIEHNKNHQAAQMQRQAVRVQVHPALRTFHHVAQNFTDLAQRTDGRYDPARRFKA